MSKSVLLFFLVWWFVPPEPPLQFWEDHPGSEKQLWLFIKDTLLDIQGIPINHEQKDENNQRACSKRKECPAGSPADLGSSRGSAVFAMSSAAVPQYTLVLQPCQGNEVTPPQQAGMYQPYPKAQLDCFRPRHHNSRVRTKPQEDSGQDLCPVPWAITLPVPPLCAQPGLCLCWSCSHTWLFCAGINSTVVTDYRNYSSPETQYFFIHMVCALKNQINNRLAPISSFYKWQQPIPTEIDLKPLITQPLHSFVSHICNNPTLWKLEFNTLSTLQDHQLWILKKKCQRCTFPFLNKYYKIEFYWVSHKMHL